MRDWYEIQCPAFVLVVQTLLIRAAIRQEDIALGLVMAVSVPPQAVQGRIVDAAIEFVDWVAAGLGDVRRPAWWVA